MFPRTASGKESPHFPPPPPPCDSLNDILNSLGYRARHNEVKLVLDSLATRDFRELAGDRKAFTDDPLGAIWPILARVFPNASFILTTRSFWHRAFTKYSHACARQLWPRHYLSRCMMYGHFCPNVMAHGLDRLEKTNVRFAQESSLLKGRLLVLNISRGELTSGAVRDFLERRRREQSGT